MDQETGLTAVAHVIQLAVAPTFLLSGISGMLAVMTSRLARVVDRARVLEERILHVFDDESSFFVTELRALARRGKLISYAITLCTITALLICAVIGVLFISAFLNYDAETAVALLFITAMLTFFLGLLTFLREIFLATAMLKVGMERVPQSRPASERGKS